MRLENHHEVVGTVASVSLHNESIQVLFNLSIPIDFPVSTELFEHLQECQGKQTGIFNCDGIYKIRIIKERTKED